MTTMCQHPADKASASVLLMTCPDCGAECSGTDIGDDALCYDDACPLHALAGAPPARLTGHDAISHAETTGATLRKHADPTEGARDGLTVEEARRVAAEDPSLIYIDAPPTS